MYKNSGWVFVMGLAGLILVTGCSPQPNEAAQPTARVVATATQRPATATPAQTSNATAEPAEDDEPAEADAPAATGIATYLSDEFHGQATASGVPYDKDALVAAHKSLPFETEVIVTNLATGATVTVIIVDRMPELVASIIDVSSAAAAELEMLESGEAEVSIEVVSK